MASTKESTPHHHRHTLLLGLIFIFVRISSQLETANNATVPTVPSSITPSVPVQNFSVNSSTNSETTENATLSTQSGSTVTVSETPIKSVVVSSSLSTQNSSTVMVTEPPTKSVVATTVRSDSGSCSEFKKLADEFQPKYSPYAKLKKCCPNGEIYLPNGSGQDKCDIANVDFAPVVIEAIFFDHCIEDTERNISLKYEIGNPCGEHEALIYSIEYGDNLYVLQNGSLLRVDDDFSGFDVFDDYCLDMDRDTTFLTAVVCNQTNPSQHLVHVSKAQSYLYAICKCF